MANKLLADIPTLTPSGYEDYSRCARLYYTGALLGVAASDYAVTSTHGQLVHDMLWRIHETGSCRDMAHVRDVLGGHGAETDAVIQQVERHSERCPSTAVDDARHEYSLARFHRMPAPMFMAVARIDAIWVHDGLLDARDYKTGSRWHEQVADVPAAKVQLYVLAKVAQRRNLRLRLRYEYLSPDIDDDPDPWEPDDDDLAAIEEDLRAAVESIWAQEAWRGVGEADICGRCRYRSICRDSATRGEPAWPVLTLE